MICLVANSSTAEERVMQLEATIQGNLEQPNVVHIIPWKSVGDTGTANSLEYTPNLERSIKPIITEHLLHRPTQITRNQSTQAGERTEP